jgi:large subunit ribosomal protein L21
MYAVIKTGGKQYKVAAGDVIEVERLKIKGDDPTLTLTPLFVVDDDGKAISGADKLADFKVGVKVVGDTKGDKITVFKYRNKSGYASKTGHRQQYSMIEITSIGSEKPKKAEKPEKAEPAKSEAADSDTVEK